MTESQAISRREALIAMAAGVTLASLGGPARAQLRPAGGRGGQRGRPRAGRGNDRAYALPASLADFATLSLVLGRVSDTAATLSLFAPMPREAVVELGPENGPIRKLPAVNLASSLATEVVLDRLRPDTAYRYRVRHRPTPDAPWQTREAGVFRTQRRPGGAFTFTIQGDSHPERANMSDPTLYARTLQNVAADRPDFHICIGDDFSVDALPAITAASVAGRYQLQRPFLGIVGQAAPIFLVNGNHEQASLFNLDGTDSSVAVLAQRARNSLFPTVGPDGFYTGNAEPPTPHIGPLNDYYAWTWGDALFVVLDYYWHSTVNVDGGGFDPEGQRTRDMWRVTLGDAQYAWFKRTLEESGARYKFVMTHHIFGTTRGGVENCDLFEWGGRDRRGVDAFRTHRPTWELPIHPLMAKHGVTIFFQGHDHLFCKQERDGVVYQTLPVPADPRYVAENADRYASGVKLPSSGHVRVNVDANQVAVEYVRSFLPADESATQQHGAVAHRYVIPARKG